MQLPDELTPEQSDAIVECLKIFARRGRELRLARERQEKAKTADALGSAATVLAGNAHGAAISIERTEPYARA